MAKIIVVEDDETFLQFWRRFFSAMGCEDVDFFQDPFAAEKALQHHACQLLISDIILPDMSGYELAKTARKIHPKIEVLLTTAYGARLSRFPMKEPRFHLLHKPYSDLVELKRLISHLMNGEDVFSDASEDTFSDNEDYPEVTEWKL